MERRARSVRTEVLAGFATLIVTFGAVALYALVRQRSAVAAVPMTTMSCVTTKMKTGKMPTPQAMTPTVRPSS